MELESKQCNLYDRRLLYHGAQKSLNILIKLGGDDETAICLGFNVKLDRGIGFCIYIGRLARCFSARIELCGFYFNFVGGL